MFEDSFRHVKNPAPYQTEIGRINLEGTFEKQRPKIKGEGCAKSNDDSANKGDSEMIYKSPFS